MLTLLVNAIARLLVLRAARARAPQAQPPATAPRARPPAIAGSGRAVSTPSTAGGGRSRGSGHTPARRLDRYALTPARRRRDRLARGAILAGTILALIPLLLIV